ncbi:SusC/RagA family TonB-linked outer membrane protein [Chitinophagaceae bacterium 26-R-25]|nr:SusC/RagA family TonB-linked outer membrane protein [Chitinophagaceae bacterium 26-R-25]
MSTSTLSIRSTKRRPHKLLLSLFFWCTCIASFAQEKQALIRGLVQSENGDGIPSVSVQVKSDSLKFKQEAQTNTKGEFSFANLLPQVGYELIFSSVGYKKETVKNYVLKPGERASLVITLKPNASGMSEVVVVGYGTAKKINVTGAVDQISGKRLVDRPIANIFQGLQGVSPGLNITYAGGQPGQTPKLNIRGLASINNNDGAPLVIIDGIAGTTDDLLRISPNDVASITVLRDAASAAIYGARASYGVILINTKEGSQMGKQNVSYNNYFAWSKRTILPTAVTDPYIYSRVLETSTDNTPWDYVNFSDEYYKWAKERSDDPSVEDVRVDPSDPTKWAYMGSNDWNNYFFNKSSFSQYHTLSFSGTAENAKKLPVNYMLSADYTDENGLNKIAKDDWNRYGLRGRLNFMPLSWLKVDNNMNVYQMLRDAPTYNVTDVYYLQPTNVAKNPDGSWGNNGAGRLASQLTDGGRNQQTRFGFQDIIKGTATFLKGDLQITGDASIKRELWKYHIENLPYKIGYGPGDIRQENNIGSITETNGTIKQDVFDLFATYGKKLGDHSFKVLAGYNQESYEWSPVTAKGVQIISASVPYITFTTGTPTISAKDYGGYGSYAIRSLFGRINYTYKDRYILEGNGRYDGSSRFPSVKRFGLFPSISAAWIVSKEKFFNGLDPVFSTLKLRASYGSLGNQNVGYYDYIQTLPIRQSSNLIDGSTRTVLGKAPPLSVDPNNYTWEKVTTANVGTDMGFFNDKIQAGFDYYVRNTTGMLAPSQELPGVLGTTAPQQNSADLSTRGWELSLGYHNVFSLAYKPFNFNTKLILSDSKSKITKYNNAQGTFSAPYRPGQEWGEIWGLTNDGMFKSKDEITKLDETSIVPWGALSIVEGWPKYKDLDGNGKIEVGPSTKDPKDLKVIGNSQPRYRVGFNLDMSWNNIDLSIFLQGVLKQDYYPRHYLFWGPYQQPYANVYPWNLDFYRATAETDAQRAMDSKSYIAAGLADANTNSYFPVLQSWLADNNYGSGLDIAQTKYMLNASYIRLKNLTLGYTLPASLVKKTGLKRLRVFFSGENLYEISAIKKYLDPESISDGYGWEYPYQRKYSFGINADL